VGGREKFPKKKNRKKEEEEATGDGKGIEKRILSVHHPSTLVHWWVLVHSGLHIVKNRTYFISVLFGIFWGRRFQMLLPNAPRCHWSFPKLNPSLRIQFLFFTISFR
jgi:hypothetical protein